MSSKSKVLILSDDPVVSHELSEALRESGIKSEIYEDYSQSVLGVHDAISLVLLDTSGSYADVDVVKLGFSEEAGFDTELILPVPGLKFDKITLVEIVRSYLLS